MMMANNSIPSGASVGRPPYRLDSAETPPSPHPAGWTYCVSLVLSLSCMPSLASPWSLDLPLCLLARCLPSLCLSLSAPLQVFHPIHGTGKVAALVEGSEMVNVRFLCHGQPFVTRVLAAKLKLMG